MFFLSSSRPRPPLSAGAGLVLQHRTRFRSSWAGFGVVLACFVLPTPPAQCLAVVWAIGPLNCGTGLSFFRVLFFLVLPVLSPLGVGDDLGILATPAVAQDCVASCFIFFGGTILPRPPSLRLWRYFGFQRFRRQVLAPSPLSK